MVAGQWDLLDSKKGTCVNCGDVVIRQDTWVNWKCKNPKCSKKPTVVVEIAGSIRHYNKEIVPESMLDKLCGSLLPEDPVAGMLYEFGYEDWLYTGTGYLHVGAAKGNAKKSPRPSNTRREAILAQREKDDAI
jgi:hypothetical protein